MAFFPFLPRCRHRGCFSILISRTAFFSSPSLFPCEPSRCNRSLSLFFPMIRKLYPQRSGRVSFFSFLTRYSIGILPWGGGRRDSRPLSIFSALPKKLRPAPEEVFSPLFLEERCIWRPSFLFSLFLEPGTTARSSFPTVCRH